MASLVVGFAALVRDAAGPDFVMVGMLAVFMALGIVTIDQGLQGFMNEGLLTVAGTIGGIWVACSWTTTLP